MSMKRIFRTLVYLLFMCLLVANVGGVDGLTPAALAQSPNAPNYSYSLSPTSASQSTFRVTLRITELGGVTPPSSSWYGPSGGQISPGCIGEEQIREYIYASGDLIEVRDYFYISACSRPLGQYSVMVGLQSAGTFRIKTQLYLPLVLKPQEPPAAFAKVSPADGATALQPLSLTLDWEDSFGADAYAYCYDITNDNTCSNWVEAGATSQAEIGSLSENTTYYWQVRAANSLGTIYANDAETAYWSFTTGEALVGGWTRMAGYDKWTKRGGHTSVTLLDGSIVLMGGSSNNDVWRSTDKGATWTQMTASAEWTARDGHTSVALADGSMVLMGGDDGGYRNDVWRSIDQGASWTQMTASAEWPARNGHTSVALADGSIVLMGGYYYDDESHYLNDVCRSTDQGATWTQITASAEWPTRRRHTSVVLPDGSIVLMGGYRKSSAGYTEYLNDVWRSTDQGATWTVVAYFAPWTGRYSHTSVALPDGSIVLMGGVGSGLSHKQDVWRSTNQGATWTQMTSAAPWRARSGHSSVVLADGSIVLMGGQYNLFLYNVLNDVWRSTDQGVTWTRMTALPGWVERDGHASVILPDGNMMLMGGYDGDNRLNDVWRSTNQGATWTQMTANAEWTARSGHTSVVLADGSIVLMGGSSGSYQNDVWRSTDQGATWTQQTATAEWTARTGHTSAALPDGSIVLMGGIGGGRQNDVWRSTDQGVTWTQMTASAEWTVRDGHASVALPDGSIVLMGGQYDIYTRLNDVWRSTDQGTTWTQMTSAAPWTARSGHTSVVLADGSIVLMGGSDGSYQNDVWRSTDQGATWTQWITNDGWTARSEHSSVALPDGSIVLLGGYDGNFRNDVWRLEIAN